jgi:hypothetical protein
MPSGWLSASRRVCSFLIQGVIPGQDFDAARLKVWLGETPVTAQLKDDLLGE